MSINTLLSYIQPHLVPFKYIRPFWEQPGAKVEILLLLSYLQMGAPERDETQSPRGPLRRTVSLRAWSALPGERQGCVSQLTQPGAEAGAV